MANMIEIAGIGIREAVKKSLEKAVNGGELNISGVPDIMLEAPRDKEHGDFAANAAMTLAREAKKAPRQIADIIVKNLDKENTYIENVEVAGPGFINFKLKPQWFYDTIRNRSEERRVGKECR